MWRGDHTLNVDEQGVKVSGTPLGHKEFVEAHCHHRRTPSALGQDPSGHGSAVRVVVVAASRPNFVLRVVQPDATRDFAAQCETLIGQVVDAAWSLATSSKSGGGAWVSGAPSKKDWQHASPVGRTGWR